MLNRLDDMLNFHAQALRLRGERQQVLASNIANADTPQFKARDMDFRAELAGALGRTPAAGMTHPGHLAGGAAPHASTATLLYRTPMQDSVDGNTVEVDAERAAFADNALRYEFNLTRLNSQLKGLLAAIQG